MTIAGFKIWRLRCQTCYSEEVQLSQSKTKCLNEYSRANLQLMSARVLLHHKTVVKIQVTRNQKFLHPLI